MSVYKLSKYLPSEIFEVSRACDTSILTVWFTMMIKATNNSTGHLTREWNSVNMLIVVMVTVIIVIMVIVIMVTVIMVIVVTVVMGDGDSDHGFYRSRELITYCMPELVLGRTALHTYSAFSFVLLSLVFWR